MWWLLFLLPSVTGAVVLMVAAGLASAIIHPIAGGVVASGLLVAAFVMPRRHFLLGHILYTVRTFSFVFAAIEAALAGMVHLYTAPAILIIAVAAGLGAAAQLRIRALRRTGVF